jgi:hypothetical protein
VAVGARRSVLVMAVLALSLSAPAWSAAADDGVVTGGVVAQPATTIAGPTGAATTVTTSASVEEKPVRLAPVVHCTWVLPDMGLDPADGQQYEAGGLSDDLPDSAVPTPCDLGAGSSPAQADGTVATAQVLPNGGDQPGVRRVEVWSAVSHAAGPAQIDDVAITVRSPSGDVVDGLGTDTIVGPSSPYCPVLSDVLAAAVRSGQMSQAAATSDWGLSGLCAQGWVSVVREVVPISSMAPCGTYTVEVSAASHGERTTSTSGFDVLCFHELVTDFTAVDWKDLVPGALSVAGGDVDPATTDRPTLVNRGNAPLAVAVTFQPLCQVDDPTVCFGRFGTEMTVDGLGAAVRVEPSPPGEELRADEHDAAGALCPGERARLDLIVATPDHVVPGRYAGSMSVFGVGSSSACPRRKAPPPTLVPTGPTVVAATTVSTTAVTTLPGAGAEPGPTSVVESTIPASP